MCVFVSVFNVHNQFPFVASDGSCYSYHVEFLAVIIGENGISFLFRLHATFGSKKSYMYKVWLVLMHIYFSIDLK